MHVGDRIVILGSAGAGKSTLATRLGEITGIPVIHLDRMFWNPGWVATPRDEMNNMVLETATRESWIIDGNYLSTLDYRIERADSIIFIDFNRYLCTYRVVMRRIKNHKKARYDVGEGCPEQIDWPFLKWIWSYPNHSRKPILEKLADCDKNVYHLKTRKEVNQFIDNAKRKKYEH